MRYEKPTIEIMMLELQDVITGSMTAEPDGSGPEINGGWNS